MSLPTITATGRLIGPPEVRRDGTGATVLRLRLLCEDGPRVTHLPVDLRSPGAAALAGRLREGDPVQVTGHLANRRTHAGHRLYFLLASGVRPLARPEVAS